MKPNHWKDYFFLLKSEQRVFLVTLTLVAILLAIKWYLPQWMDTPYTDRSKLENYLSRQDSIQESLSIVAAETIPDQKKYPETDINLADIDDWSKLDFSQKQARVIINYRKKIGEFKSVEDLLNVFVVDEFKFDQIRSALVISQSEPQVQGDESRRTSKENSDFNKYGKKNSDNQAELKFDSDKPYPTFSPANKVLVEINSADSLELVSLQGIGPYYASKIMAYRNSLGGFYNIEQLNEVYRMRSETVDNLRGQVNFDTSLIRKININECQFKELMRHPYFDFYYTKKVINHREKNGKYTSLQDLLEVEFIDSVFLSKSKNYLTVE